VDGVDFDGGVTAGVSRDLGCSPGQTTCNFDVALALNDPQNGAFHTGANMDPFGTTALIPSGQVQVVVEATDRAQEGDGGPGAHAASNATAATVTRFLWQYNVGRNISGLAVHPDGDLIATSDGGTDQVYDLAPDQPVVRWSFGSTAGLTAVSAAPVIGQGDAQSAPIYVASRSKSVYALAPDGGVLWHADTLGTFAAMPAVAQSTIGEQVIAPSSDTPTTSHVYAVSDGGVVASAASDNTDGFSSPVILSSAAYFGTSAGISRHAIGDGNVAAATTYHTTAGQYAGLITDGTSVYGQTRTGSSSGSGTLVKLDSSLGQTWAVALTRSGNGEPVIGLDGNLLYTDNNSALFTLGPAGGTPANFLTLSNDAGSGRAPSFGSDGTLYVPRANAYLQAFVGKQLSWALDPTPSSILRAAVMDCQGRLFLAAGSSNSGVIFAVLTDDKGLADTPWPSWRRDSRNTGNPGLPKYGIRTASGCIQ
jgi:hypothetical protein